jgi:hypothetical protein
MKICENCKFIICLDKRSEGARSGLYVCRRFPQRVEKEYNDWCGEFEQKHSKTCCKPGCSTDAEKNSNFCIDHQLKGL